MKKLSQRDMLLAMEHECEWLSQCCGASSNEFVDTFCNACNEWTEFECDECNKLEKEKSNGSNTDNK